MIISLIVAVDDKWGIGKNARLPWHVPTDLKRFKQLTMGHYLVMGRKTYESIGGTLPGREMIVISRQAEYSAAGCRVVHSLAEALKLAEDSYESELFIIGGGEIFRQSLALADRIYLTQVHTDAQADIHFPRLDSNQWHSQVRERTTRGDKDEYATDFQILERRH